MAIQLPNAGLGDGKTGDNEFVMWSKVKDNFNNTSHAASRLVGTSNGNLVEMTKNSINGRGLGGYMAAPHERTDLNLPLTAGTNIVGDYVGLLSGVPNAPNGERYSTLLIRQTSPTTYLEILSTPAGSETYKRATFASSGTTDWVRYWNSSNTDADGTNGYLKPSSPILKVESGRMWGNSDGDRMGATYTKKGVGHYEIVGTTGIRNDGWYIEIPNDLHGNPHVAVTIEDNKGNITLKCFKRVFNMDTFKFEPDLEQPLDIPDGRWIDLRFNDLPDEIEDDTQTEEVVLEK